MAGCWEHLRRDAEELAEEFGKGSKAMLGEIRSMYEVIAAVKDNGEEGTRNAEMEISEMTRILETLAKGGGLGKEWQSLQNDR